MSKNKPKDKKNDAASGYTLHHQEFKSSLNSRNGIWSISNILSRSWRRDWQKSNNYSNSRTTDNERLANELQQVKELDEEKIKILNDRTEDDEKRLNSQINRIT